MNLDWEINEITKFGGFWVRVGAHLIDTVVLLIPTLLIQFLLRAVIPAINEMEVTMLEVMDFILTLTVWWVYFAVLHSSPWQASLGKKALNLKVVDVVDRNGNRISFGRATGRYFAANISMLILYIGFMMVGWTKRKRGLYDMIAGTFVIYVLPAKSAARFSL